MLSLMKYKFRLVVLALSLVLAACAPPPVAAPKAIAPSTDTDNVSAKPIALTLAIGGESEEGYDPTLGWGRYGSPLFHSTLLRRNENLNIVNDLATGYTVSPDKLTWTVKIRTDTKFSDGSALTATDVAYTYKKSAESGGLTDMTVLKDAIAQGDDTIVLTLKEPQSTFVNRMITLGIVPQKLHGKDYSKNPIGSGPYKMVQWDKGQQLIVETNPYYYGGKPSIERITFLFVDQEADGALLAAKAGKVQIAGVPQSLASQKINNMRLVTITSVDNRGLMFPYVKDEGKKTKDGNPIGNNVTSDKAIRQAINFAIDRQALVKGALDGFGSPAFGPVSGTPWEQKDASIQDNNVDTANKILMDGGWKKGSDGTLEKDGLKAAFTLIYPASDATRQALALGVEPMIKQLGIQVNVEGKSWDDIQKAMYSNVILFGWGSHDQTEIYNLHHSKTRGQGWYNTGFYANAAIDNYMDMAMGASTEDEANVFWKRAQWDMTKDGFTTKGDPAWAWMVNLDHTYYVHDCLDIGKSQVEPHGHGWPITANITAWKWTCAQ